MSGQGRAPWNQRGQTRADRRGIERPRYAEAEPLYQRALKISEAALGPENPSVGIRLHNLAGLYRAQGRYAQAEPFLERALRIMEKALGPSHPSTVTLRGNLEILRREMPGGAAQ